MPPLTGVECLAAWPIRPQTDNKHSGRKPTTIGDTGGCRFSATSQSVCFLSLGDPTVAVGPQRCTERLWLVLARAGGRWSREIRSAFCARCTVFLRIGSVPLSTADVRSPVTGMQQRPRKDKSPAGRMRRRKARTGNLDNGRARKFAGSRLSLRRAEWKR